MATPRYKLVDSENPLHYHLVSRCVRNSWCFGYDIQTRKDYSHRKDWVRQRFGFLAQYFAVDVMAYTIMSNHYHLVVYFDPSAGASWSDEEVVDRWLEVCPPLVNEAAKEQAKAALKCALLDDALRVEELRGKLCSLSTFMKHLNQYIASRANREDQCKGHFFEERFYSGALLDEEAVLATMAYVDLNPVRAKIATRIEEIDNTSIKERLKHARNTKARLQLAVEPLIRGLPESDPRISLSLAEYFERIALLISHEAQAPVSASAHRNTRWIRHVASIGKRQRAFGCKASLTAWLKARGMQRREQALEA